MSMKSVGTTLLLIFGSAAFTFLNAQEIVHATAGALAGGKSADSLSVKEPGQSAEVFRVNGSSSAHIDFDKLLRSKTETPDKLANAQTNVIVYYYGYSPQIAVAVKDLGTQVSYVSGKITSSDKGQHSVTIRGEDGKDHICYVDAETTLETASGVVSGAKDFPRKGQNVNAVCKQDDGKEDAQLIVMLL
jgi:hypothetical protein